MELPSNPNPSQSVSASLHALHEKGTNVQQAVMAFYEIIARIDAGMAEIDTRVAEGKIALTLKTDEGQAKLERQTLSGVAKLDAATQSGVSRIKAAAESYTPKFPTADNPAFQTPDRLGRE